MEEILHFLKEADVFFAATVQGERPRVRPIGIVMLHEGRFYFSVDSQKSYGKELRQNPNFEVVALNKYTSLRDLKWLRLWGKAVFVDDQAIKDKSFEASPALKKIWQTPENPVYEVFYLDAPAATWNYMSGRVDKAL